MGKLMQQTPVHFQHNPDLLKLMEINSRKILEIGCSSGALAREFKQIAQQSQYYGVEIDPSYAELARKYCDKVYTINIDEAPDYFWDLNSDVDGWIFGDTLEHLKDPWKVLSNIKNVISADGYIAACIPNAQHWSVQARLATGNFLYEENGLMDKTHLRWFTKKTIFELFNACGFQIIEFHPRIFNENINEGILPAIGKLANAFGEDEKIAMMEALPLQYVVKAVPIR